MASESDILQLLKDYRSFHAAYGGAMPLDETYVSQATYGPGGLITTGVGFEKRDIEPLRKSYRTLNAALRILRREHFQEWGALIEPYLSDVADHSVVADWRTKIADLDAENAQIRRKNEERVKKGRPPRPEKVRLVYTRLQLGRHDRALGRLARYLKNANLHVVNPKLMSTSEKEAGQAANAQLYAYYQQIRVSGRTHRGAVSATAWKLGISEDEVERIIEFRADVKLATCAEVECERTVFQQNLCQKHYQREWRTRKGRAS